MNDHDLRVARWIGDRYGYPIGQFPEELVLMEFGPESAPRQMAELSVAWADCINAISEELRFSWLDRLLIWLNWMIIDIRDWWKR